MEEHCALVVRRCGAMSADVTRRCAALRSAPGAPGDPQQATVCVLRGGSLPLLLQHQEATWEEPPPAAHMFDAR